MFSKKDYSWYHSGLFSKRCILKRITFFCTIVTQLKQKITPSNLSDILYICTSFNSCPLILHLKKASGAIFESPRTWQLSEKLRVLYFLIKIEIRHVIHLSPRNWDLKNQGGVGFFNCPPMSFCVATLHLDW